MGFAKKNTAAVAAPSPVVTNNAPVAPVANITAPQAQTAPAPAPQAAQPAPVVISTSTKKTWTPQENAETIINAYKEGSITLDDAIDDGVPCFIIKGDTSKVYGAIKALGGRVLDKQGEGKTATYAWVIRKEYIDVPETGAAVRQQRLDNRAKRREERAAKATAQQQTAATVAPQAAPVATPKTITLTEAELKTIIAEAVEQGVEKGVTKAITALINKGVIAA